MQQCFGFRHGGWGRGQFTVTSNRPREQPPHPGSTPSPREHHPHPGNTILTQGAPPPSPREHPPPHPGSTPALTQGAPPPPSLHPVPSPLAWSARYLTFHHCGFLILGREGLSDLLLKKKAEGLGYFGTRAHYSAKTVCYCYWSVSQQNSIEW